MNRQEVIEFLNELLAEGDRITGRFFNELAEYSRNFEIWKEQVLKDAEKFSKGRAGQLIIPTTPAAASRLRRRQHLSIIRESHVVGDNSEKERSRPIWKTSRKLRPRSSINSFSLKRFSHSDENEKGEEENEEQLGDGLKNGTEIAQCNEQLDDELKNGTQTAQCNEEQFGDGLKNGTETAQCNEDSQHGFPTVQRNSGLSSDVPVLESNMVVTSSSNSPDNNTEAKTIQNTHTPQNEHKTSKSVSSQTSIEMQKILNKYSCRELSVSIQRISIQSHESKVAETCRSSNEKVADTCKSSNEKEGRFAKESTGATGETTIKKSSVGEKRKRSKGLSCQTRGSKRVHLDANVKPIENINELSVNTSASKGSNLLQTKRFSSRVTGLRNIAECAEVNSFSDITTSNVPENNELNDIFEDSIEKCDENHENNVPIVENTDSGKGSSTDNDVECSEYFSSESKLENSQSAQVIGSRTRRSSRIQSKNIMVQQSKEISKGRVGEFSHPAATSACIADMRSSPKTGSSQVLFSVYANEPVKNRVAAYEALSPLAEEVEFPTSVRRVTRTKTRALAAAAAAAAAATRAKTAVVAEKSALNSDRKSNSQKHARSSVAKAKRRLVAAAKKREASKENSLVLSAKNTGRNFNFTPLHGSKILADVNVLSSSSSFLNSSKKTPLTAVYNSASTSKINRTGYRPGVILSNVETFIKKPAKVMQDAESKKIEELMKREEKEREAQRRKEFLLKAITEEKRKKQDELRLRVQQKREAQEKEKQESQLRVGREKDEKWNLLQQEREAKQKGNVLKKRLETERKAAEARRKIEDAESARIAKLKMEELQRRKEIEEAEKEQLRRNAEEKEESLLREKTVKELNKAAKQKAAMQKNAITVTETQPGYSKVLNETFNKPLDSTFTVPEPTASIQQNINNAYNLEDLLSEDSDEDSEDPPRKTAPWATKEKMLLFSKLEVDMMDICDKDLSLKRNVDISKIFPSKRSLKRTSSAIWNTPPRYSTLPKY